MELAIEVNVKDICIDVPFINMTCMHVHPMKKRERSNNNKIEDFIIKKTQFPSMTKILNQNHQSWYEIKET